MSVGPYPTYKIFLDLDGVMADFEDYWLKGKTEEEMWDAMIAAAKNGKPVWGELNLMPDAMILWNYVKHTNPIFLTATGVDLHTSGSKEKREWVRRHFNTTRVITTKSGRSKANWSRENHVLIDDMQKNLIPWEAAGGIGILHRNTADTISKLKKLGV